MAKDPAVLWYTSDFLTGTNHFTNEEIGLYARLLALQHQQGHLSEEFINRIAGKRFPKIWPVVKSKFSIDNEGNFFNERMEKEIEKRKEHSRKQKEKVVKRWNNRGNTVVLPLENENENENQGRKEEGVGETIEGKMERFELREDLPLPAIQLEMIERNQFTCTGKRNTDFIAGQWKVFIFERMYEKPQKYYANMSDLAQHFVNWMREKFPKPEKQSFQQGFGKPGSITGNKMVL